MAHLKLVREVLTLNGPFNIVEVADYGCMHGETAEVELAVIEGEREAYTSKVVVPEQRAHRFDFLEFLLVLCETRFELAGQFKSRLEVVAYRPKGLRKEEGIQHSAIIERLDVGVYSLGLVNVFHHNGASLHGLLTEADLHEFDVGDLLLEVELLRREDLLGHHILILRNESLLRTVEADKNASEVLLLSALIVGRVLLLVHFHSMRLVVLLGENPDDAAKKIAPL